MSFERAILQIIEHAELPDYHKKACILKIVQHSATRNVTFQEISSLFDMCFKKAIENSTLSTTFMSFFTFSTWGEKYPNYLKEYLTVDRLTQAFAEDDPTKLSIILMWLNKVIQILMVDADFVSLMSPIMADVLQSKLEDCGKCSQSLSRLAELYVLYPSLLPQYNLRTNFTISIMKCVAAFQTPTKPETLKHMKSIGSLITMLWETLQLEDILETLISMYRIISNTDSSVQVCPAMGHLLSLVNLQVVEKLGPRIVSDPQNPNGAFIATLTRLSNWLVKWPTAHSTLIHWIQTLVKLLYQHTERRFVPAKVTFEQTPKLLEALRIPVCRQGVMTITTTFLMSFQCSYIVFHRVIPQLISLIRCLGNESSGSAKKTLEDLVLLCHGQMTLFPGHPEKYQPLMDLLSKHPTPSDSDVQLLIQNFNWNLSFREVGTRNLFPPKGLGKLLGIYGSDSKSGTLRKREPNQKVGLRNLGNTCYMNSVIQALFMTDDFRKTVLHMSPKANQHLLVKLQRIFSLLSFSHRCHIAPRNFHDKSRPSWFSPGAQQDCNEYLRHLMSTLHEEEKVGQKLPDYQERVIIESETASLASDVQITADDCASITQDDVDNDDQNGQDFPPTEVRRDSLTKKCLNCNGSSFTCSRSIIPGREDLQHTDLTPNSVCNVEEQSSDSHSVNSLIADANLISAKRKYISPITSQLQNTKISKGDVATPFGNEIDNSSDSGISGDLAEDDAILQSSSLSDCHCRGGLNRVSSPKDLIFEDLCDANDYFISQVHKVFGGKILTCIKCLNCKTESIHKDTFTDLNLAFQDSYQCNAAAIIQQHPPVDSNSISDSGAQSDLKIEDMISNYFRPEMLIGDNQYECERCDSKQDAERSLQVLESPEHLVLTQLRFYYDTNKMQRQKVFTNVKFAEHLFLPIKNLKEAKQHYVNSPEIIDSRLHHLDDHKVPLDGVLNLSQMQSQNLSVSDDINYACYSLYGVVVHSGLSSEGGHYYCYARNSSVAALPDTAREKLGELGGWYNFNDETVTKTTFSSISRLTKTFTRDTAYILFYRKIVPSTVAPLNLISEDFADLHLDLREAIQQDNLQYQYEQESEIIRQAYPKLGPHSSSSSRKDPDRDGSPPPPSGGCGGGEGMNISSRVVF